ncbi:MAG: hypothetical protein ACRCVU_16980, partial [Flavobacterium sp.]
LIIVLVSSCSSGLKVKRSEVLPIDNSFKAAIEGTFVDTDIKEYRKNVFLSYYKVNSWLADTVHIHFNENDQLLLTYKDTIGTKEVLINGRFVKKKYYEYFNVREKVAIPPLFQFIYSKIDVNRIRLGVTKNGEVVLDQYYDVGGNIFIMAAGHTNRYKSSYPIIK